MFNVIDDRATNYARRVVNGDIVMGELHRFACQRHLRDLELISASKLLKLYLRRTE